MMMIIIMVVKRRSFLLDVLLFRGKEKILVLTEIELIIY